METGYLKLYKSGELQARVCEAYKLLEQCRLCPRRCKKNRLNDQRGICATGIKARVASYAPHFGEESPLVGRGGSGAIFFSGCNLLCVFCQNYDISHLNEGVEVTAEQLASIMVELQQQGCHNINFVTPSHVVVQILEALPIAVEKGLTVPLVYNSSGYDLPETLRLLDGVVDIYMPDFKFWSRDSARQYCKAPDYPEVARAALKEMHRQAGDLVLNETGLAEHGMLVRHLVMPEGLVETEEIFRFLATEISSDTYVNVMDQYRPGGRADQLPPLDRRTCRDEYQQALQYASEAGLTRLDQKDLSSMLARLLNQ